MLIFRSWLLTPVARSPQRCQEKAESRGGSEEVGLGSSEFAKQALSGGEGAAFLPINWAP